MSSCRMLDKIFEALLRAHFPHTSVLYTYLTRALFYAMPFGGVPDCPAVWCVRRACGQACGAVRWYGT